VLSVIGVVVGPVLLLGLEREIIMSRTVVVGPISDPAARHSAMFDSLLLTSTDASGSKRTMSSFSKSIRSSELVMPAEVNVVTCVLFVVTCVSSVYDVAGVSTVRD
jgi:hypothetical protein